RPAAGVWPSLPRDAHTLWVLGQQKVSCTFSKTHALLRIQIDDKMYVPPRAGGPVLQGPAAAREDCPWRAAYVIALNHSNFEQCLKALPEGDTELNLSVPNLAPLEEQRFRYGTSYEGSVQYN